MADGNDILTQLQDCLDLLATQFYASIYYINTHHNPSPLPTDHPTISTSDNAQNSSDPSNTTTQNQEETHQDDSNPNNNNNNNNNNNAQNDPPSPNHNEGADAPDLFASRLDELATDLVQKEQQIEKLIARLPGIGSSAKEQEDRIRVLEAELQEAEEERIKAAGEREDVLARLDEVVRGVRRE
ncbi:MAG: RNA polymerase II mediator complex subunit [Cirrosporium novae-zelandiae]|nr:MAG: RNA polymerase II mediator complex subunit [Cirrosporium novae-zelandiae]